MTKVLILIDNLDCGGAQELIYYYAKYINSKKFSFIICNLGLEGTYSQRLRSLGLKVYDLNSSQYNITVAFKVYRLVSKENISIIHSQFGKSHLIAPILGALLKKKVILHNHSGICDEHLLPYLKLKVFVKVYRTLLLWLFRWVDLAIGITEENKNEFIHFQPKLSSLFVTLHNGIAIETFQDTIKHKDTIKQQMRDELNIPEDAFVIGIVARLSYEKGHRYLLEAIKELKYNYPDVMLLVIGNGQEEKKLKLFSKQFHLDGSVRFLGERSDVPRLLTLLDLFVLSSVKEPFGLVLLEAMVMKVPIICSDSGGPKEIIENEVNGLKVSPRNVKDLSAKITQYIENVDQYHHLVEKGYETVCQNFDLKKIVLKLERIYEQVLKGLVNPEDLSIPPLSKEKPRPDKVPSIR